MTTAHSELDPNCGALVATSSANLEIVRRLYDRAVNAGDVGILNEIVSDRFLGPNGERGVAELAKMVQGIRDGFPDIQFTIDDLFSSGDRVVVRWSSVGTHLGRFRGVAPTGRRVTNSAIAIYQLEERKIVRLWLAADRLGVLQQIGALAGDFELPRAG